MKALFGSGAYTTKTKELIDKWPYDPKSNPFARSAILIKSGNL